MSGGNMNMDAPTHLFCSIALLIFGLVNLIKYLRFAVRKKTWVVLEGTIIVESCEDSGTYVKYKYKGDTYKEPMNTYNNGMYDGKKTKVHVNPDYPNECCTIETSDYYLLLSIMFMAIGVLILLTALNGFGII